MQTLRIAVIVGASAFLCAFPAYAEDSQSLGDVARQARLQKQQKEAPAKDASAKDASSKDASATSSTAQDAQPPKPPHVFTNDEIPEHVGPTATSVGGPQTYSTPDAPSPGNRDARAEQWKSQIRAQKNSIASLQREIASLSESVHYAGGNCVRNCVERNERQKEKQDRAESMKVQLEEQQKRLEDMQEAARKQGFGSSVYDQ